MRSKRPPPQLHFDDGSRIMAEKQKLEELDLNYQPPPRHPSCSIREYYEIDRLSEEVYSLTSNWTEECRQERGIRIALQFPDELLSDAAAVCWEFDEAMRANNNNKVSGGNAADALVFCLGDTTFAACCPDQVAAAHLQADVLIHFGHACLIPCNHIPVLYSFGRREFSVNDCVEQVLQAQQERPTNKLLLLYEVCYHHAIEELRTRLNEQCNMFVVAGEIPRPVNHNCLTPSVNGITNDCGQRSGGECCKNEIPDSKNNKNQTNEACEKKNWTDTTPSTLANLIVGGLELPADMDWTDFTLLYIGNDESKQFLNIAIRFQSGDSGPQQYWTWQPSENRFSTQLSPNFRRQLNRRFYLVQKARDANVFGILVANLSDTSVRSVVASLRRLIQRKDEDGCGSRSCYTLVVGKINPAKLANFAEIECFVLVACPEHSLLEHDREYHVPVVTPLELSMALGVTEWGSVQYSLGGQDYLKIIASVFEKQDKQNSRVELDDCDDDDDAPYFSLVTGKYESRPTTKKGQKRDGSQQLDLSGLPGQGQLTTYSSAAADFLKQREYQGLQVELGSTKVRTAQPGLQGIASNYGTTSYDGMVK